MLYWIIYLVKTKPMKKYILLLLMFVACHSVFGQTVRPVPPGTSLQPQGSQTTFWNQKGIIYPTVGYAPAIYFDTLTANLISPAIKNIPFFQISTTSDGKSWQRNMACTKWESFAFGSGSVPGIDDVLAVGQQITQNRNVNNGGYNLNFYSNTDKLTARFDSLQRVQTEWLTALNDTASDFEIIVVPDIQNMVTEWPGTVNPTLGQEAGRAMFQWMADNITSKNIKAVISLGDLTNNGISPELDTADAWFDLLDASNVMYVPTIGNHDYNNNAPLTRNASNYLSFFGPSRIGAKSWYGGNYASAPESYFTKFDLMGRKFGAISLEFFPRQAVINWADSVLTANEDRTFFYITHGYLTSYGERSTDTSYGAVNGVYGTVSDARGDSQWVKLVKKHKNIAFTLNGHFINTYNGDRGFTRKFTDVGDYGNVVNQFFVNYQMDTSGGNGWLARFQFHPKENRIDVKYYSPYLDRYDQRVESFAYQFPAIAVQSSIAVQGTLSVKNEARFDSTVTFEKLEKYNIPFIGENGGIRDTALFRMDNDSVKVVSDYFQTSKDLADTDSTGNVPSTKFVKKNFLHNQLTVAKTGNYWINGKGVVSESTSGLYRSALQSGATATMYVAQGSGYGLSIQRASNVGGYPQLTFFKDNTSDFSTLATPATNGVSGGINWQNVAPDNSTITTMARIWDLKEGGSGALNYTGIKFSTSGATTGQLGGGMYLSGDGTLVLGGACYSSAVPCTAPTNAWLDMQSTTRGFLPPRLNTTQMNAISSPGVGLVIWNPDSLGFCSWDGTAWRRDGHSIGAIPTFQQTLTAGSTLLMNNTVNAGNTNFIWNGLNYWEMNQGTATTQGQNLTMDYAYFRNRVYNTNGSAASYNDIGSYENNLEFSVIKAGKNSYMRIFNDSIDFVLNNTSSKFKIENLATGTGTKVMRYDPATKYVTYSDETSNTDSLFGLQDNVSTGIRQFTTSPSYTFKLVNKNGSDSAWFETDGEGTYVHLKGSTATSQTVISVGGSISITNNLTGLAFTNTDYNFQDNRTAGSKKGLEYAGNYAANFTARSLVDKNYVDSSLGTVGGGTPGGSDTHVQFNDGGAFGGDAGFLYNKTTNVLSVGADIKANNDATASTTNLNPQITAFSNGGNYYGFSLLYQNARFRTALYAAQGADVGIGQFATSGTLASNFTEIITVRGDNPRVGINNQNPSVALDVTGAGAFSGAVTGLINAYDATGWNGSAKFATEDAIRDKIESLPTYFLSNVGSGYRLVIPGTNNVKTVTAGVGIKIDSSVTNQNDIAIVGYDEWLNNTVQTTDATVTTLATITPPDNSRGTLEVTLIGLKPSDAAYGISGKKFIHWKKVSGTLTVSQIVGEAADYLETFTTATWTVDASGGTLRIRVTGEAATTVDWQSVHKLKYSLYSL